MSPKNGAEPKEVRGSDEEPSQSTKEVEVFCEKSPESYENPHDTLEYEREVSLFFSF